MYNDFIQALGAGGDQPAIAFQALAEMADGTVGMRLFTVLVVDTGAGVVRRAFSNMPEAYPVSGTKPIEQNDWTRAVLERGETKVMNDADALAEVFSDHTLIASLGCASCINVPVIVAGRTLGTLNCLHVAGHYTPERVSAGEALKLPGAAALMLAQIEGAN